jgi:hypothetical protein
MPDAGIAPDAPIGGAGGKSGTGGSVGTGGVVGTGGKTGTGGIVGTGGKSATGGSVSTGGVVGTGGKSGTGGIVGTGGSVSPALLTIAPSSASFGTVLIGAASSVASFTIKNTGAQTSGVIALVSNSAEFASQGGSVGDCVSGVTTLAASESCMVRIVFTPAAAGDRSGTIAFSAAPGGSGSVSVTGVGIVTCTACDGGPACVDITSDPAHCGSCAPTTCDQCRSGVCYRVYGNYAPFSSSNTHLTGYLLGWKFPVAAAGVLRKVGIIVASGSSTVQIALYADTGANYPGRLVMSTTATVTSGRNEITVSTELAAGDYWLMVVYATGTAIQGDVGGTANVTIRYIDFTEGETLPDPFPSTSTSYQSFAKNYYLLVE